MTQERMIEILGEYKDAFMLAREDEWYDGLSADDKDWFQTYLEDLDARTLTLVDEDIDLLKRMV